MKRRSKRKVLVAAVLFGVVVAAVLGLTAFEENLLYFYSPTQVKAGEAPDKRTFRVGGLVVNGSVEREKNSLTVRFILTDNTELISVDYTGILPDLFRSCGFKCICHFRRHIIFIMFCQYFVSHKDSVTV